MAFSYKAGLGSVGSYQVSGVPWITGSGAGGLGAGLEHTITFPSVTKSVLVRLSDASNDDIRVHFNATGSGNVVAGNHFYTLSVDRDAISFNVKCNKIYISNPGSAASGYNVVAELTGISPSEMFDLTGSGLTD